MMRIDFNNFYPGISYQGGANSIPRVDEQSRVPEQVTQPQEAPKQPVSLDTAEIAPVERGNQAPQEAAQLIKPFNTSIPDFTTNDRVYTQDMAKAVSDMQKDDMLREYQYFVGSANNNGVGASDIAFQDEDGLVRRIS